MLDNYTHEKTSLVYTKTNIPGPGCNLEDFNVQLKGGCNCVGLDNLCTSTEMCECVSIHSFNYELDGRLVGNKFDGPVLECNSECGCYRERTGIFYNDVGCKNRVVQNGPRSGLEIFKVNGKKGLGLRTLRYVDVRSFICEYAGEVIGVEEARLRLSQRASSDSMNYVFILKEYVGDSKVIKTCVDPTVIGNIGRYINHSCQPNAAIVPVRVDELVPKLAIFAVRDIDVGEEITFDYGDATADRRTDGSERKRCLCGSSNCRGFLPYEQDLV